MTSLFRGALAAFTLFSLSNVARAEWTPRVVVSGPTFFVNDRPVVRVRKPLSGLVPDQRAAVAAHRLRDVLAGGLSPEQVTLDIQRENRQMQKTRMVPKTTSKIVVKTVMKSVEKTVNRTVTSIRYVTVGKGIKKRKKAIKTRTTKPVTVSHDVPTRVPVTVSSTVMVPEKYIVTYQAEIGARLIGRGFVLLTASVADAQAGGKKLPSELAEEWAVSLKRALQIPGLTVSENGLIVPLKEGRMVTLGGAARGPIAVRSERSGQSPLDVTSDSRKGTVTLLGAHVGRDVVYIEREGAQVKLDVSVQPYAVTIDRPQPVVVTGAGVDVDRLARLVNNRLRDSLHPEPGASVKFEPVEEVGLPASGQKTVSMLVTASGSEMLPVRKKVGVPIQRQNLPTTEADALLFSNNPERIEKYQTLYVGRLQNTARLLYHHQSALDADAWFSAELINDGDTPSEVQVIGGDAGPVKDTIWVGFRVASEFLTAHASNSGMVVTVPPKSRLALQALRLPAGLTISGLMELRLVSGPGPLVRIAAEKPGDPMAIQEILTPTALSDASEPFLRDVRQLSEHVYPKPGKQLSAKYSVGGNFVFMPIGRTPIAAAEGAEVLAGNYGVFYNIDLALENPTKATSDVNLVFEAAGGMAGAVFEIDGRRVEIPRLAGSGEQTLLTYRMEPGARKSVRVRTMPLSGSNYPVKLIVRS